jgi:anti-anti-sigma factor
MATAGDALVVDVGGTAGVAVLRVRGEVDAASAGDLAAALDGVLRDHPRHVVLDAAGVTFIDSNGVSVIMDAQRRLNRTRRRLAVACRPASALAGALATTGLHHSLEVHPAVADAIAALEGAPLLGR